jgi:diadenosine tetraphosphate (Ap4A) HIT family hydrolase
MPSVFSRIIAGEIPGSFIHSDARCAAFLSINPLRPGHALVVPRAEVDHWDDLDPADAAHLMAVGQRIARAQKAALAPRRVGLIVAGFEVPHAHLHVVPIDSEGDLDFRRAAPSVPREELEAMAARLRAGLSAPRG